MKTPFLVVLALTAAVSACCATPCAVEPPAPAPLTQLDGDQVNALLPFMVDRRKDGALEHRTIEASDRRLVMHQKRQAFTFALWVDEDGRPVAPPEDGGSSVALKRPTLHHGAFDVLCVFACQPATSAESCELIGCEPFADDSCGCTPLECSGCIPLFCDSTVSGAFAGTLVML